MEILLVEDDKSLSLAMAYHLKKHGHHVTACYDGHEALAALQSSDFDLALLDRMLPGPDGVQIVRRLRQASRAMPVLFITAMDGVSDRVEGLDAGADDYLVKPFAMEEMLARVRALSRRPVPWVGQGLVEAADLVLDSARFQLSCGGASRALTPTEGRLMELLMRNADQVLPRSLLMDRVWRDAVEESNLDTHIHFLRKHLEALGSKCAIRTARGIGYQLSVSPEGV